ncbi:uncharacterized protein EV422DRAFT_487519, partial [Fimicolochytrium jonesii]|uniref:uncharacterized protein n=1 Tax=Fimicolochytrium jonesii TaxID=1396493 RepID=UPI0022FDEFB9
SVLTAAALVIFLVTFFVVNYPEIRRSRFDAANMTVDEIDIASRYCCERSCDDTCSNSFFGTRCDAMQNAAQALDPTKCTANSTNAALCPLSGPAATCDNGDYCCATCCSTCQSCTTSCSGTGSSQSCTTSCSSYECNCYCCSETAHQQCTMQCNLCYAVEMHVEFNDRWRRKTTAELSMDFKRDLNAAQVFFNAHLPNSTFVGYYDTHDTSVILLSRDFTVKPWIGLASATLPLFLAVLI